MYTRHTELPILSARSDRVSAVHYNIVQRALHRTGQPLRLALPGLRTLDLILQADAWVVVDRAYNDIPVTAWTDFLPADERGLHEAVGCKLRFFHTHAELITQQVLDLMDDVLQRQLNEGDSSHQVLTFPKQETGEGA